MLRDVSIVFWRFLLLWALLFWQGGFLFYASVVVPMANIEIGHSKQGLITRHVTWWLNIAALASLACLALDMALFSDPRPMRRRLLWATWLGMALCQAMLFVLHPRMNELLDAETWERQSFRSLHKWYLWTHAG